VSWNESSDDLASSWGGIQLRTSGEVEKPTLIYLPGLHGDWTLIRSFRLALKGAVRFVEITYPRTIDWSLRDYAAGVQSALKDSGITSGWVLAESFGSQVAWQLLQANSAGPSFEMTGLILAGGFVRHPISPVVSVVHKINRAIPMAVLKLACRLYAAYARLRHRRAPETLCDVQEFVRRRSEEPDRRAVAHRYTLIKENDFRPTATEAAIPIFQLSGFFDPIVPWFTVRRWLKRNCSSYAGWKLIWAADHNVLGSAPEASAHQILAWINSKSSCPAISDAISARTE